MNGAEKIIDELKDIFEIATEKFSDFYEDAEKKEKGDHSKAASSGYYSTAASSGKYSKAASCGSFSTAASSGYYSKAASSGNYSKAVSSGYFSAAASSGEYSTAVASGDSSKAVSSGDYSKAASSGYFSAAASSGEYSTAASSGYSSTAASSGDHSKAASSGDSSTAVSSGDYSKAASSGDYSTAASSGYFSTAASSGNYSKAVSSGDLSTAASSGYFSTAASSGKYSKAVSSGDHSKAASSGEYSKAASSGKYSTAKSSGEHSSCSALGYRAAVKGSIGNLLMASEYKEIDGKCIPVGGKADLVDGKNIKPDCWYIVENAKWVEVDFSDGIFSYVVSTKGDIKKVKTEEGKIYYIVTDGKGNYAHGETVKEARDDLVYKTVAKFDGELPEKATVREWIGIYRAVTGACGVGVREFVEGTYEDLEQVFTAQEVSNEVSGHFGAEKFKQLLKGGTE